jgi:uncharacterized protein (UPF0262 family)
VSKKHYITNIHLDEKSVALRAAHVEHERNVAIYDILDENYFMPEGGPNGPFELHLSIEENRLIFQILLKGGNIIDRFTLPLNSFRRIIKDYFMICESYFEAIKTAPPSRIEALDMGRRGLHNEGADILRDRLAGKVDIDIRTARGLFTLICVLHIKA